MATALTAGYIYVLNWLATSGDPENYDLDDGTEGEDYCRFKIPMAIMNSIDSIGEITTLLGGKGHVFKEDSQLEVIGVDGEVETRADLLKIKTYQNISKSSTNAIDYLVIKYGTNDYFPFVDEDHAAQEYARGWFKTIQRLTWSEDTNLINDISIRFNVVN